MPAGSTRTSIDQQLLTPPWARRVFGIDLRSLALFRISFAAILIADLIVRATDLTMFYTDAGVLPVGELNHPKLRICLHALSGGAGLQAALFAVAGIAAFAMLLGYRTRLATLISFVLLCSLHTRNSVVLQGGDTLIRAMHFWILFLPTGARWSLDALRGRAAETRLPLGVSSQFPNIVFSAASAVALGQIVLMYWFTATLKHHPVWWSEGLAVHYALHVDYFTTPLGIKLREFPRLLTLLTWGTIALEFIGPLLAFLPFKTARLRMLAVLLFVGFHFFGLRLTMELGLFSWTSTAIWFLFIPSEFWDRWLPRILGKIALQPRESQPAPAAAERPKRDSGLFAFQNCVVAFLFLYAIAWNIRACDFKRFEPYFPRSLNFIGDLTGLRQHWSMFAPRPMRNDGWYVVKAPLVNGEFVDLLTGEAVSFEKPEIVSATYKNQRWRKYFLNLRNDKNDKHRKLFAHWAMEDWNRRHESNERAAGVRLIYIREWTTETGVKDPERLILYEFPPKPESNPEEDDQTEP